MFKSRFSVPIVISSTVSRCRRRLLSTDFSSFFFFLSSVVVAPVGRSVGRSLLILFFYFLFVYLVCCSFAFLMAVCIFHTPISLSLSHLFTHSILDWNGVFARRCFVRSRACGLLLHRQKTSWITENGFRFNDAETDSFSSPMYSECASLNTFHFVFIPFLSIRWKVEDHRTHICSFIII